MTTPSSSEDLLYLFLSLGLYYEDSIACIVAHAYFASRRGVMSDSGYSLKLSRMDNDSSDSSISASQSIAECDCFCSCTSNSESLNASSHLFSLFRSIIKSTQVTHLTPRSLNGYSDVVLYSPVCSPVCYCWCYKRMDMVV